MIGIGIVGLILLVLAACIGISEMRVQHGPGTTGGMASFGILAMALVFCGSGIFLTFLGFSNGITIGLFRGVLGVYMGWLVFGLFAAPHSERRAIVIKLLIAALLMVCIVSV
ncbi:MAG: hypothetical protein AAB375_02245 [Patescibacteria group bacterium]